MSIKSYITVSAWCKFEGQAVSSYAEVIRIIPQAYHHHLRNTKHKPENSNGMLKNNAKILVLSLQREHFFMQYNLGDHKKVPKPYTSETRYLRQALSTRNDEKITQPYKKFVENLCIANHDIWKFLSRTLLMFLSTWFRRRQNRNLERKRYKNFLEMED